MTAPRHWRPLILLAPGEFASYRAEVIEETATHYGISEDEALARLQAYDATTRVYVNDIYQVQVAPSGRDGQMLHLNIRRRDGGMFKDWRHFQQIKNEIAGPEREAVEIYPAESRKVDTTNKWHLWVFPEGVNLGLGWGERDVSYKENRDVPGMRQRPL